MTKNTKNVSAYMDMLTKRIVQLKDVSMISHVARAAVIPLKN